MKSNTKLNLEFAGSLFPLLETYNLLEYFLLLREKYIQLCLKLNTYKQT